MKKLKIILTHIGIYFISFVLFSFAISKFFNFQFRIYNYTEYMPLGQLSPFSVAWSFFGYSYTYNLFLGIAEFLAALLILFHRTRLIGLLMALAIYINIVIVDIEFHIKDALFHACFEFVIVVLLLIPYLSGLKKFFWDLSGRFEEQTPGIKSKMRFIIPVLFAVIVCTLMTLSLFDMKSGEDKLIGAYTVTSISKNNGSLPLKAGAFTKEPMIFFEFGGACLLSINDSSFYANYEHTGNRITITMKKPNSLFKTLNGTIENGEIKGETETGSHVSLNFSKLKSKDKK